MTRSDWARLAGFALVAIAIAYHAHMQPRFQLGNSNSLLVRLDVRTGATVVCLAQDGTGGEEIAVPCTGHR